PDCKSALVTARMPSPRKVSPSPKRSACTSFLNERSMGCFALTATGTYYARAAVTSAADVLTRFWMRATVSNSCSGRDRAAGYPPAREAVGRVASEASGVGVLRLASQRTVKRCICFSPTLPTASQRLAGGGERRERALRRDPARCRNQPGSEPSGENR